MFSIEPFHLITIRKFEVVVRAIGGSLFMVLTTYVLHLCLNVQKRWAALRPVLAPRLLIYIYTYIMVPAINRPYGFGRMIRYL